MELRAFRHEVDWLASLVAAFRNSLQAAKGSRFSVALAGGNTPAPFYRRLAGERLAWSSITFWIGDERCVPPNHPERNERMVRAGLGPALDHAEVLGWGDTSEPALAAHRMEQRLRADSRFPAVLDLAILGLGIDGHTASLFPGTPAADDWRQAALAVQVPRLAAWRLSLGLSVLSASPEAWFLVRGPEKTGVLRKLAAGDPSLVASKLGCAKQTVFWLESEPGSSPAA